MSKPVFNTLVTVFNNGDIVFKAFNKPKSREQITRWYRELTPDYNENVYCMHLYPKKYENLESVMEENLI